MVGVAAIPVGIAGVNGLIEATVVEGEVPFLLSVQFLRELDAVIDFSQSKLCLKRVGAESPLIHLPSGHVAVDVVNFPEDGWKVPHDVPMATQKNSQFRMLAAVSACFPAFMSKSEHRVSDVRVQRHGVPQTCAEDGDRVFGCFRSIQRKSCGQLEKVARESRRCHGIGSSSSQGRKLANKWIARWCLFTTFAGCCNPVLGSFVVSAKLQSGDDCQGRDLLGVDQVGKFVGHPQVQNSTSYDPIGMSPSSLGTEWSGQSVSTRSVVQAVPQPLVGGPTGDGESCCQGSSDSCQWQDVPLREALEGEVRGHREGQAEATELEGSSRSDQLQGTVHAGYEASSVLMWKEGGTAPGEERRAHARSSVLEVQQSSLPVLRVGSGGDGVAQEEGTSGEGRPGSTHGGGDGEGRARGVDPHDLAACRVLPSDDFAGGAQSAPEPSRVPEKSVVLDECGGWRESNESGVSRSGSSRGDDEEGNGVTSSARSTRSRGPRHVRFQDDEQIEFHGGDTMSSMDMDQWLQSNAPRVCMLENEHAWDAWASKQIQDYEKPESHQEASLKVWFQKSDGVWQFHHGILPSFGSTTSGKAVGIFGGAMFWMDELFGQGEERALSKASRKGLKKHMKQLVVAEVYSPPRVSEVAQDQGHVSGGAFDLKTGFDLSLKKDRLRCWKELTAADPDLLVVCPPCDPFSILQGLNQSEKAQKTLKLKLAEGREHLKFAMQIFEWQVRRKKSAVFEHPTTSKAWEEKEVKHCLSLPGVQRVRADLCEYGMAVQGVANKKPTDFMVNGVAMMMELGRRCGGGHQHQHLIGGIARLAEKYPKRLCQAMIEGACRDTFGDYFNQIILHWASDNEAAVEESVRELGERMQEEADAMNRGSEAQMPRIHQIARDQPVREDEVDDPDAVPEGAEVPERALSQRDKDMVQRLHNNLGHPGNMEFCKALRMARARNAVWRYVKNEFRCPVCARSPKPKSARPSTLPKTFEPCRMVGVDVVYFPALDVRQTRPVLNIVDWATGYQMLEPLENMQSQHVWEKFQSTWARTFSIPEVVIVDQGREFSKDFSEKASESGALLRIIGARAPWQQGKTERHGGLAKEIFMKVREDILPVDEGEWKMCIHSVEAAKNRLFNRSGFSPAQRQFGYNLRLPGSLGSDDVYDPALVVHSTSSSMQRCLEIRHSAMQAFIKHTTNNAIVKAQAARSRVPQEFQVGDIVYVYRVPLQRRRARSEIDFEDREGRRATWVGPGTIVMLEGANAWLSIRGELWKCAREQLRKATLEEEDAKLMLGEDFDELRIELTRKESKRGFRDITSWERPPPMVEDVDEGPPRQRARLEEPLEEEGSEEALPNSDRQRSVSADEPAQEPEVLEKAMESVISCEQLDDTLRLPRPESSYGPARNSSSHHGGARWRPYHEGSAVETVEEEDDYSPEADLWVYDEARGVLLRQHNVERAAKFTPSSTRGCPVPVNWLSSEKRVIKKMGDGSVQVKVENWRRNLGKSEISEGPCRWWVGWTEFKLRKAPQSISFMVKKSSDEVLEEEIPPEEWEAWRVADGAEWSKVESTGAVKVLSPEESAEVERQLKEAGLEKRILPSRIVRRWKPSEQPGVPPSRKSRWCVRGDKDPDLLDLSRHAPTVTTATLAVVLQIAASMQWKASVGDLRNAFMQSDRLQRMAGRLFCKQPRGGLPQLQADQLIEILAGAYGSGDAPAHWRKSLKKVLFSLGFQQSIMDPCVYKWFHEGELQGILVVEVDDLFAVGGSEFYANLEKLRQRFQFGKFVFLQEENQGASFNGRRIRQTPDCGFLIDMEKFVDERLNPVELEKGRKSQPEDLATEAEKNATRAAVGSLTWAAKEGRPDAAVIASMTASRLNRLTVQDIIDLNKGIVFVKTRKDLALRIQHIPMEKLCWGVVTDASYANAVKGKSQGAYAVLAFEEKLLAEGSGKCHILHWRSGKIHRVVNLTLAAETQALSRGLAELTWTVTVFNEFITKDFDMRCWQAALAKRRLNALISDESEPELKRGVSIVDAKSLYDHLSKETTGFTDDKRTALEMQVIRQAMAETATGIKWVPHPKMIVDALTKKGGNLGPLYDLIDSGLYRLFESKKKLLGAVE